MLASFSSGAMARPQHPESPATETTALYLIPHERTSRLGTTVRGHSFTLEPAGLNIGRDSGIRDN